jgi:hypothetical protein
MTTGVGVFANAPHTPPNTSPNSQDGGKADMNVDVNKKKLTTSKHQQIQQQKQQIVQQSPLIWPTLNKKTLFVDHNKPAPMQPNSGRPPQAASDFGNNNNIDQERIVTAPQAQPNLRNAYRNTSMETNAPGSQGRSSGASKNPVKAAFRLSTNLIFQNIALY